MSMRNTHDKCINYDGSGFCLRKRRFVDNEKVCGWFIEKAQNNDDFDHRTAPGFYTELKEPSLLGKLLGRVPKHVKVRK